MSPSAQAPPSASLAHRHRKVGWWGLALFAGLGLVLEALHAFKAGFYLDAGAEPRRLMLTLGHAHGTLLSAIHLLFAHAVAHHEDADWHLPSRLLSAATILLPGGFVAGAFGVEGGDPGPGAALVPAGALALLWALAATARRI